MSNKTFVGIVRFTSHQYANDLVSGQVYFGAAENYRHREDGIYMQGIADFNESCIACYRSDRDFEPPILKFRIPNSDGSIPDTFFSLKGIKKLDVKMGTDDHWLSCWYSLFIDEDDIEHDVNNIQEDMDKMRNEFGTTAVFIFKDDIAKFVEILNEKVDVHYGFVGYTKNHMECNVFKKRYEFKYQKEFRFVISGCPPRSKENKLVTLDDSVDGLLKIVNKLMFKDGTVYYK
ncbi:hypothetical protein [Ewingella americana]|uniref:hypothetical protein n=1 Tax=Ewingella americana TaxID=41202 RepID=UPI0012AE4110|nr:hypothetical protein [Ewingella americana]MRT05280.1 hypothetical protein [Ewingella americana]